MAAVGLLADLGILLAFLLGAAFFSISETALIAVPRHQVRKLAQEGNARASLLDHMLDEPERVLSTVLVGNNLINIGATAYATVVSLGLFGARGAVIATFSMAVLITVMSEIVPKTFAVQRPLPLALALARPLRLAESLLKPIVLLLASLSRGVARIAGAKPESKAPFITADEIEMLVREGVKEGEVEHFEQRVISELFDFTETDVHRTMTPRDKVHFVDVKAPLRDAAELASREGRTRVVVVNGDFDHVVGFVHVKDLLRLNARGLADAPVTRVLRDCLYAGHDQAADRLLMRMQKEHKLLAVIQDADKRNIGICTVEDLLEELVGEIKDELALEKVARTAAGTGADPPAQSTPKTAAGKP